jgi:hypothetical protein
MLAAQTASSGAHNSRSLRSLMRGAEAVSAVRRAESQVVKERVLQCSVLGAYHD